MDKRIGRPSATYAALSNLRSSASHSATRYFPQSVGDAKKRLASMAVEPQSRSATSHSSPLPNFERDFSRAAPIRIFGTSPPTATTRPCDRIGKSFGVREGSTRCARQMSATRVIGPFGSIGLHYATTGGQFACYSAHAHLPEYP